MNFFFPRQNFFALFKKNAKKNRKKKKSKILSWLWWNYYHAYVSQYESDIELGWM